MIGSRRGVMILCAVAAILVAVALVDATRTPPSTDRAIAHVDGVATLAWGAFVAEKRGDHWFDKLGARLDDGAIDAVISTLRGARWHRRDDDVAIAGPATATLAAGKTTIAIGKPLGEQQWIIRDGEALLVDAWVARALSPAPWQLYDKTPFDEPVARIEIVRDGHTRLLVGEPRRIDGMWIDPSISRALDGALARLTIVGPVTAIGTPSNLALVVGERRITDAGPCPNGTKLVADTVPLGCVDGWPAVTDAAVAMFAPNEQLADRRPAPIAPISIEFPDGEMIDVSKAPTFISGKIEQPADHEAVAELLAVLAAPAEVVTVDNTEGVVAMTIHTAKNERMTLALRPPDLVLRQSDQVGLRVGEGAFAILAQTRWAYRDRTMWREDPTTIARLEIDGAVYERAGALGEWRRPGGQARPLTAIERFAGTWATARALGVGPMMFVRTHHGSITVEFGTTSVVHTFDFGAPMQRGCPFSSPGFSGFLPLAYCVVPQP